MTEMLSDFISDSFILVVVVLLLIFIGFIFFLLGKVPLFRWIGIFMITIMKYVLITIFNILAIGVISGLVTIGAALAFALFYYLEWELFMIGSERLFVIHNDAFYIASFLTGLCFVVGVLFGTLLFSFVPLSTRTYVVLSYIAGGVIFILSIPTALQYYTPEVEATLLGRIAICVIIPILGLIFAIGTGQKRKERRRGMTMRERKVEDEEERRSTNLRKYVIFPWIRMRSR